FNLNFDRLTPLAQEQAKSVGFEPGCVNSFKSIIARAVELVYACEEALRIIQQYEMPPNAKVEVKPNGMTGYGCTEAPRGILYHRYVVDGHGIIRSATIVPPTSQNQKTIENDLFNFAQNNIEMPEDELTWRCEQVVRNYDPCISCSCHFLKLNIERIE
ncbi:nickel-dependent hydrogenase large subunit, partial [bacterium]|nr:nickel-dependent hydrogenase large subunit [bacterium]